MGYDDSDFDNDGHDDEILPKANGKGGVGLATEAYDPYEPAAPQAPKQKRGGLIFTTIILAVIFGFIAGAGGYIWGDDVKDILGIETAKKEPVVIKKTVKPSNSDKTADDGTLTPHAIYEAASPGVVHITATRTVQDNSIFGFGQLRQGEASGSGFAIDEEGHIVTNAHVVESADKISVSFSNKKEYEATVVGRDVSSDLAVLKVEAKEDELKKALVPLTFADSETVEVGDPVVAIGNPFNLDRTLTSGIVSALQREIQATNGFAIEDVIQTDAAVNPGNSGGPLLNMMGEVIGVNSQIASAASSQETAGNVGIAFAIPSNTVKQVVDELVKSGSVKHAWFGVTGTDVIEELTQPPFDLPVKVGVILGDVSNDSPADKAGLKGGTTEVTINGNGFRVGGDVLVEFDGKKLTSMRQLLGLVNGKKPGDKVKVVYYRGNKKKETTVTLGTRPEASQTQSQSQSQ